METVFRDRTEAGQWLAGFLVAYTDRPDVVVLGLPRGGIVVANEVAHVLRVPLDMCVVRKLGAPGSPEFAMGAIASGGVYVLDQKVVEGLHLSARAVRAVGRRERRELHRREKIYRGSRPVPRLEGRTVLLIDDGFATGRSMRAAILAVKRDHPARLVVAAPVGSADTCDELQRLVDELICPYRPAHFRALGLWYVDFPPVSDKEVCGLLESAARERGEVMNTPCRVYQYLKDQKTAYQSFSHRPALSAQRLAQVEGMSGQCHAKMVMAWMKERLVMLVLDANHEIDFTRLAYLLATDHVRLAAESEFRDLFPDCRLGAIPPFGNLYGFSVILDSPLAHKDVLCFPDGTPEGTIIMSMQDYRGIVRPRVISFASRPLAVA